MIKTRTERIPGMYAMRTFVEIPGKENFVISSIKIPRMVMEMDASWFGKPHKDRRFETAVFPADEEWNIDYGDIVFVEQFRTWDEAVACHKKLRQTVESKGEFFLIKRFV